MKFTEGSFAKWGYELAKRGVRRASRSPRRSSWDELGGKMPAGQDPAQGPHRRLHLPADPDPARRVQRPRPAQPERRLPVATPRIALVGGLGLGPGANMSRRGAPSSRPPTAPRPSTPGMDKVEPRLDHPLGRDDARPHGVERGGRARSSQGIERAIKDGQVTYDLARLMKARGPQGRQRAVLLRLRRGDHRADVAVHAPSLRRLPTPRPRPGRSSSRRSLSRRSCALRRRRVTSTPTCRSDADHGPAVALAGPPPRRLL